MTNQTCQDLLPINFTKYSYSGKIWKELDYSDYIKIFAYIVIILGGLLGNISVILTVAIYKSMRTTINLYIANLAVTDAMICIMCMVPHVLTIFSNLFMLGEFVCKVNPFTQMVCLTCSVLTLSAISCDRFMAIMFPLYKRVTKQRISVVMTIVWIVSISISIPLLIYTKYEVRVWKDFMEPICNDKWPGEWFYYEPEARCIKHYPLRNIFYIVISIMLYFLPVVIMISAYSLIIWKLWMSKMPGEQHEGNTSIQSRARKKLPGWFSHLEWFSYYFSYTNSFLNPIIYGWFNKNFREHLSNILRCKFQRDHYGNTARSRLTFTTGLKSPSFRNTFKTLSGSKKTSPPNPDVEMEPKHPITDGDVSPIVKDT